MEHPVISKWREGVTNQRGEFVTVVVSNESKLQLITSGQHRRRDTRTNDENRVCMSSRYKWSEGEWEGWIGCLMSRYSKKKPR